MAITNINGDAYEVDRVIAQVIDEMRTEVETLRNALVRLAVFVGGEPCWCRYAKTGEHTEACRAILELKLWPRVVKGRPKASDYLPWQ